jgi:hypothetical protein
MSFQLANQSFASEICDCELEQSLMRMALVVVWRLNRLAA